MVLTRALRSKLEHEGAEESLDDFLKNNWSAVYGPRVGTIKKIAFWDKVTVNPAKKEGGKKRGRPRRQTLPNNEVIVDTNTNSNMIYVKTPATVPQKSALAATAVSPSTPNPSRSRSCGSVEHPTPKVSNVQNLNRNYRPSNDPFIQLWNADPKIVDAALTCDLALNDDEIQCFSHGGPVNPNHLLINENDELSLSKIIGEKSSLKKNHKSVKASGELALRIFSTLLCWMLQALIKEINKRRNATQEDVSLGECLSSCVPKILENLCAYSSVMTRECGRCYSDRLNPWGSTGCVALQIKGVAAPLIVEELALLRDLVKQTQLDYDEHSFSHAGMLLAAFAPTLSNGSRQAETKLDAIVELVDLFCSAVDNATEESNFLLEIIAETLVYLFSVYGFIPPFDRYESEAKAKILKTLFELCLSGKLSLKIKLCLNAVIVNAGDYSLSDLIFNNDCSLLRQKNCSDILSIILTVWNQLCSFYKKNGDESVVVKMSQLLSVIVTSFSNEPCLNIKDIFAICNDETKFVKEFVFEILSEASMNFINNLPNDLWVSISDSDACCSIMECLYYNIRDGASLPHDFPWQSLAELFLSKTKNNEWNGNSGVLAMTTYCFLISGVLSDTAVYKKYDEIVSTIEKNTISTPKIGTLIPVPYYDIEDKRYASSYEMMENAGGSYTLQTAISFIFSRAVFLLKDAPTCQLRRFRISIFALLSSLISMSADETPNHQEHLRQLCGGVDFTELAVSFCYSGLTLDYVRKTSETYNQHLVLLICQFIEANHSQFSNISHILSLLIKYGSASNLVGSIDAGVAVALALRLARILCEKYPEVVRLYFSDIFVALAQYSGAGSHFAHSYSSCFVSAWVELVHWMICWQPYDTVELLLENDRDEAVRTVVTICGYALFNSSRTAVLTQLSNDSSICFGFEQRSLDTMMRLLEILSSVALHRPKLIAETTIYPLQGYDDLCISLYFFIFALLWEIEKLSAVERIGSLFIDVAIHTGSAKSTAQRSLCISPRLLSQLKESVTYNIKRSNDSILASLCNKVRLTVLRNLFAFDYGFFCDTIGRTASDSDNNESKYVQEEGEINWLLELLRTYTLSNKNLERAEAVALFRSLTIHSSIAETEQQRLCEHTVTPIRRKPPDSEEFTFALNDAAWAAETVLVCCDQAIHNRIKGGTEIGNNNISLSFVVAQKLVDIFEDFSTTLACMLETVGETKEPDALWKYLVTYSGIADGSVSMAHPLSSGSAKVASKSLDIFQRAQSFSNKTDVAKRDFDRDCMSSASRGNYSIAGKLIPDSQDHDLERAVVTVKEDEDAFIDEEYKFKRIPLLYGPSYVIAGTKNDAFYNQILSVVSCLKKLLSAIEALYAVNDEEIYTHFYTNGMHSKIIWLCLFLGAACKRCSKYLDQELQLLFFSACKTIACVVGGENKIEFFDEHNEILVSNSDTTISHECSFDSNIVRKLCLSLLQNSLEFDSFIVRVKTIETLLYMYGRMPKRSISDGELITRLLSAIISVYEETRCSGGKPMSLIYEIIQLCCPYLRNKVDASVSKILYLLSEDLKNELTTEANVLRDHGDPNKLFCFVHICKTLCDVVSKCPASSIYVCRDHLIACFSMLKYFSANQITVSDVLNDVNAWDVALLNFLNVLEILLWAAPDVFSDISLQCIVSLERFNVVANAILILEPADHFFIEAELLTRILVLLVMGGAISCSVFNVCAVNLFNAMFRVKDLEKLRGYASWMGAISNLIGAIVLIEQKSASPCDINVVVPRLKQFATPLVLILKRLYKRIGGSHEPGASSDWNSTRATSLSSSFDREQFLQAKPVQNKSSSISWLYTVLPLSNEPVSTQVYIECAERLVTLLAYYSVCFKKTITSGNLQKEFQTMRDEVSEGKRRLLQLEVKIRGSSHFDTFKKLETILKNLDNVY